MVDVDIYVINDILRAYEFYRSKNIKIDKDLLLWVAKRDMISEMVSF